MFRLNDTKVLVEKKTKTVKNVISVLKDLVKTKSQGLKRINMEHSRI